VSKNHKKKTHIHAAPQRVRIIAGNWKGRLLPVLQKPGLRPTPNRIRETVFNWLQAYIDGSECLDLFAGSGALGFEAASRGASHITLVEKDLAIVKLLTQQVECLQSDNIEVQHSDGLSFLQNIDKKFDIIFLDPPFNQIDLQNLLAKLAMLKLVKPSAKVYIESPLGQLPEQLPDHWSWWRRAKASRVEYGLIATD
jgi:16S rRNA (guanine966-N2)-methyltransferase